MVRINPFGVLLKLYASGQSDAFLLLLLGFTADVHVIHLLLRQAKSFRIYAKNFHPGGLRKWQAPWVHNPSPTGTFIDFTARVSR